MTRRSDYLECWPEVRSRFYFGVLVPHKDLRGIMVNPLRKGWGFFLEGEPYHLGVLAWYEEMEDRYGEPT